MYGLHCFTINKLYTYDHVYLHTYIIIYICLYIYILTCVCIYVHPCLNASTIPFKLQQQGYRIPAGDCLSDLSIAFDLGMHPSGE